MPRPPLKAPNANPVDCVVLGAGPAGLTAATYLARFRRSVIVVDAADSRARRIPASHNCPGFPAGIGGAELLRRLHEQARQFGARFVEGSAQRIDRDGANFVTVGDDMAITARCVILATGCEEIMPDMEHLDDAIARAALRLCPVCDGYEAIDKDIAVYGPISNVVDHALFVRTFSQRVTVVPTDGCLQDNEELRRAGVGVTQIPQRLAFDGARCSFAFDDGQRAFDVVYPTLGSKPCSVLATAIGARCDKKSALVVSKHQMTSVQGLYAAGDVVSALDQIAVAVGHAAIAATAIHARLPRNMA